MSLHTVRYLDVFFFEPDSGKINTNSCRNRPTSLTGFVYWKLNTWCMMNHIIWHFVKDLTVQMIFASMKRKYSCSSPSGKHANLGAGCLAAIKCERPLCHVNALCRELCYVTWMTTPIISTWTRVNTLLALVLLPSSVLILFTLLLKRLSKLNY